MSECLDYNLLDCLAKQVPSTDLVVGKVRVDIIHLMPSRHLSQEEVEVS